MENKDHSKMNEKNNGIILDGNINFKFSEEKNLAVFTTQATLDGNPILSVHHDLDGDWQFFSEEDPKIENSKIVSLEYVVKTNPRLNEIHFLEKGHSAYRSDVNSEWLINIDRVEE